MAWTHCVSDIPMTDWVFFRRMHAVTVDHQVYLFDSIKSRGEDIIQVLVFNPRTHTVRTIQPDWQGEESVTEILSSSFGMVAIHFAVAYKEKVYLCVGGMSGANGGAMLALDTRRSQWSCVRTSGDVPSGATQWRVCACEEDGHLYAWAVKVAGASREGYLWALEMSSLRWKIVASAGWSDSATRLPRCIFAFMNRIYLVIASLELSRVCPVDEVTYFDLGTRTWERPQLPGTAPLPFELWMPFVYHDHLYMFLKEKRENYSELCKIYDNVYFNKGVLRYSFVYNKWEEVRFRGVTPPDTLHLVCVVDNMVVFFSLSKKKAYVLDFSPSLRSLCFQVVSKYHLDSTLLPALLKKELLMYNYSSDAFK